MPLLRTCVPPVTPATSTDLIPAGWSSAGISRATRSGELVRVLPDLYIAARTLRDDRWRVLLDAGMHAFPDAVAVLGTAARIHGLPEPWPSDRAVELALPPGRERVQRPRYAFHTWKLGGSEVTIVAGVRVTTVERTLVDLMCLSDRFSAISAVDAALNTGKVSQADVDRLASSVGRRRGAARSRSWWSEVDGRSESPLESRARLRAVDGGYPPDELQLNISTRTGHARGDLAWRLPHGGWLVLEGDGARFHDRPEALYYDRRRNNAIAETGQVTTIRAVWSDTATVEGVPRMLAPFLGAPRHQSRYT
jgi:hypothetical protein